MEMTPYQKSLVLAISSFPKTPTLGQVAEELRSMGWTGESLSERKIQAEMSKMAFHLVKEAEG